MASVLINILIPIAILLTLSGEDRLGPIPALLLAVGIPVLFGIYTLQRSRRVNISTVVGIVSVLLTGLIGVLRLDAQLFAIKEAAVPIVFALLIVISDRTRFPIVRLLANQVVMRDRVERALDARGTHRQFRHHLTHTGRFWAGIMTLSGIVKFFLATWIVTSPSGTIEFNRDLAQFQAVQVPTSTTLTMILMLALLAFLVRGTQRATGLPPRQIFKGGERMASFFGRFGRAQHSST
ncbi:MAG TPA: VC0807 family protein [Thermomicrobiales bacterium]|nr:VC0807 family protein [Thermomicrobiales bacterium]